MQHAMLAAIAGVFVGCTMTAPTAVFAGRYELESVNGVSVPFTDSFNVDVPGITAAYRTMSHGTFTIEAYSDCCGDWVDSTFVVQATGRPDSVIGEGWLTNSGGFNTASSGRLRLEDTSRYINFAGLNGNVLTIDWREAHAVKVYRRLSNTDP